MLSVDYGVDSVEYTDAETVQMLVAVKEVGDQHGSSQVSDRTIGRGRSPELAPVSPICKEGLHGLDL
jgi:hypothetical protein